MNNDIENKEKIEEIKKQENKRVDFVNAIYQNIQTAIMSIDELLKINEDKKFEEELIREKDCYNKIKTELLNVCEKIKVTPKDNSMFEKARLWSSIKFGTMTDKSVRHLAEMMLLGTVMGTLTCYKDLCDYKKEEENLYHILEKLRDFEEDNFDVLKSFLKDM